MGTDIRALARATIEELFDQGRTAYLDEVSELSYVGHDPVRRKSFSLDDQKRIAEGFREGFPDLHCAVIDTTMEGDRCVCRWRMSGTHTGNFLALAPTGRKVVVDGISEMRFHQGRLAEQWTLYDCLGLMSQLGVLSSFEEMEAARRAAEEPRAFQASV